MDNVASKEHVIARIDAIVSMVQRGAAVLLGGDGIHSLYFVPRCFICISEPKCRIRSLF